MLSSVQSRFLSIIWPSLMPICGWHSNICEHFYNFSWTIWRLRRTLKTTQDSRNHIYDSWDVVSPFPSSWQASCILLAFSSHSLQFIISSISSYRTLQRENSRKIFLSFMKNFKYFFLFQDIHSFRKMVWPQEGVASGDWTTAQSKRQGFNIDNT